MIGLIGLVDVGIVFLRAAIFTFAALTAVLAAADWAVRTRRINPFGRPARLIREHVQPWIAPVERKIVRAGGNPASAPWWTLVFVILGGIVVLSLVGFLRQQLVMAAYAMASGPGGLLRLAVGWTFMVLQVALMVRVITSWVGGSYSRVGRLSASLTDWFLVPLRQVLPTIGMIDISPLVAWFVLGLLQNAVMRVL